MSEIFPAGISSPGNNLYLWLDTEPEALADLTAGTDITDYIPASEMEIGFDQERENDTRAGDASARESFGTTTFTREEIVIIVDPQGDGTEPGNLADGAIEDDALAYCAVRMGVPRATAASATDKWDVYEVQTGASAETPLQSGKYVRRIKSSPWQRIAHRAVFAA